MTTLCCPREIGLAIASALSESLEVEVRRNGWSWHQRFAHGVALASIDRGARTERTGTRIRFHADTTIFDRTPFDRIAIRNRLRELAALNPMVTFDLMAEQIRVQILL